VIGNYKIVRELGRGGHALVYEAVHQNFDRVRAVKTIPLMPGRPDSSKQIISEYETSRGIPHREHILEIDFPEQVECLGLSWLLLPMDKADSNLRHWLQQNKNPIKRLRQGLEYLAQTCKGVAALHDAGIAHLDLKPENLLLKRTPGSSDDAPEFVVKVADFGLSRNLNRLEDLDPRFAGYGVGTPHYMAPEQIHSARQRSIGPLADIYSLGVLLYELLDGQRPFDGTPEQVRDKHLSLEPEPIEESVPDYLKELAYKCLRKNRNERPQSALELVGILLDDPEENAVIAHARDIGTEAAWRAYLEKYPKGRFAIEAQQKLAPLQIGRASCRERV